MGNHDYALIHPELRMTFNYMAREAIEYHAKIITPENREIIKQYPYTLTFDRFSITHSSFGNPPAFTYILSTSTAGLAFSALDKKIGFFGHTHLPMIYIDKPNASSGDQISEITIHGSDKVFLLEEENLYLINPGSIGQPRDHDFRSSFVIYDEENGSINFQRLTYNCQKESRRMLKLNLPDFLTTRILTGQ